MLNPAIRLVGYRGSFERLATVIPPQRICTSTTPRPCAAKARNRRFFVMADALEQVKEKSKSIPPQHQERQPGAEHELDPRPVYFPPNYRAAGKLEGKVALITGGDSGIGRSVACLFAAEGAEVAFTYKAGAGEEPDKDETIKAISEITKQRAKPCAIAADLGYDDQCQQVVDTVVNKYGRIDVLVNNAGEQFVQQKLEDIPPEQLERTFRSNIFSQFFLTRQAVKHMKEGGSVINTTSVVAYTGNPLLLDYTATKGAIVAFTKGLSQQLNQRGIRVNAVAPGPIWTPLIPSSFPDEKITEGKFGGETPMKRPGQPYECGTAYVFLASEDASYISGQVIHVNGGEPYTS